MQTIREKLMNEFSDCFHPMTRISDNMISSEYQAYDFDEIAEKIYTRKNVPRSVDGLLFDKKKLIVVEFKGGMRDKVPMEYGNDAYRKDRERIKREQTQSVYTKGLDTYLILEHDFGLGITEENKTRTLFIVVIDDREADVMDEEMSILNEASGKYERRMKDNEIDTLQQALRNLNKRNRSRFPYMYDAVTVMTATDFKRRYCMPQKEKNNLS